MKPLKATVYIESDLTPKEGAHVKYVVQRALDEALQYRPVRVVIEEDEA